MTEYTTREGRKLHIDLGKTTLTVLRFPHYRGGSDSPKAIICTGVVSAIQQDGEWLTGVTIQCPDPQIQATEHQTSDLLQGKIQADAVHMYLTKQAALQEYAEIVEQDYQESMSDYRHLERRLARIKAERERIEALVTIHKE
jgi:hypothetical protein